MAEEEQKKKEEQQKKEEEKKKEEGKYPGGSPMLAAGIYALVAYMLLMVVVIVTGLVVLWPPIPPERKVEAQRVLERGTDAADQNQSAAPADQTPAAPGATPAAGAPAPGATPAPGGAAARATPQATPQATPHPLLVALKDEPDEHKRIFDGQCRDMNGEPRAGVAPLKVPFVTSLRLPVTTPRCVYDEDRLLLIVLFAGALGGMVYVLRSLVWYIGNRSLKWSWSALYFLTPFTSGALALIFYFVVRGGFFSPTSSVTDTSPFGFAALAALIGMFTENAINKLRSVAETLLAGKEQGKDHVGPAPVVTSISPQSGSTKGGEPVDIIGDNFRPGVTVTFGGGTATVEKVEARLVKVRTPKHAAGKVEVVVKNDDDQQHVSRDGFEYKDEQATGGPAPPPGPPTISAIKPDTGTQAGGESVTVTGANFADGASVTFGSQDATGVAVVDAGTIEVLTPPAGAAGTVEVVVTNPDGVSTSPVGFTYTAGEEEPPG